MEREIILTEQERNALQEISQRTGRTENELVREAVGQFIGRFQIGDRRALLQQARGIWKGREDLPAFRELRNEWDRI